MRSDSRGKNREKIEVDFSAAEIGAVSEKLGRSLKDDGCRFNVVEEEPYAELMNIVNDFEVLRVRDQVNNSDIRHEDPEEYIEWKVDEEGLPGPLYEIGSDNHPVPDDTELEELFESVIYFAAEDSYQTPDTAKGERRSDIYTLGADPKRDEVYLMRSSPNDAFDDEVSADRL